MASNSPSDKVSGLFSPAAVDDVTLGVRLHVCCAILDLGASLKSGRCWICFVHLRFLLWEARMPDV